MNDDSRPTTGAMTVRAVVARLHPNLRVLAESQPVPEMRRCNVLFITRYPETAREAIVALEEMKFDDDRLGTMVLGRGQTEAAVDAEGVGRAFGPRILIGGLIGAVVGAVLGGGIALVFGATAAIVLVSAGVGVLLGAVVGAMWSAFGRMGGTEAYQQTFVDDSLAEMAVVSVHTDNEADADAARDFLAQRDGTVVVVNASGIDVSRN